MLSSTDMQRTIDQSSYQEENVQAIGKNLLGRSLIDGSQDPFWLRPGVCNL